MPRRTVVITAFTVAALFAPIGGSASAQVGTLDTTCPAGNVCFWDSPNTAYAGTKRLVGASFGGTGWHSFENIKFSLKNRFDNRVVWTRETTHGAVACFPPGANSGLIFQGWFQFAVGNPGQPC